MKSHPDKHNNKKGVLAKKARNRLEIRRMRSEGVKNPLQHVSQMLPAGDKKDACSLAKKRNFDYKESTSSSGGPSLRGDVSGEDKELKEVVGNMSSDLCYLNSDSTEGSNSPGEQHKEDFAGKDEAGKAEESGIMTRLTCGFVSVIGRRRVMEDALTVSPGTVTGDYEFFAAYDGHGGARVANACRERLHHLLEKELQGYLSLGNEPEWTKVMKACFSIMDDEVLIDRSRVSIGPGVEEGEAERAVGSTALVVMVGPEELVVANCGDSRAVLCRGGVAMALSNDHKPDRPDEKERVEAAGGRIINWDGCRVQGVLATSRSIGDHYLKPYVISEPEVTVNKRTDADDFLIIATDGLWDVVPNDVACEVVRRCLNGRIRKRFSKEPGAAEAAAILAEVAIAKGSRDNISVIVVDLRKASSKASRS